MIQPVRRNVDRISKELRWRVLERDNFTCRYCGQSAPDVVLHVDHIVPIAEGGNTIEANLVTACAACNLGKSRSLPREASAASSLRNLHLDRIGPYCAGRTRGKPAKLYVLIRRRMQTGKVIWYYRLRGEKVHHSTGQFDRYSAQEWVEREILRLRLA